MKRLTAWFDGITTRLRFRVAHWIDRRYGDRVCWANLASWAVRVDTSTIYELTHSDMHFCWLDVEKTGRCYCGKLRKGEDG